MDTILGAIGLIVRKVTDISVVKEKMDSLERNVGMVSARKADISLELEQEESRPRKKRKREVELWMQSVGSVEDQVHKLRRKVKEARFFSRLMLVDQVTGLATEVDILHKKGRFDNGLTLDVKSVRGCELQPGELAGQTSRTNRDEIWDCLMNEKVLRVGTY
ncbi:hypothetical protein ACJRO7_023141 [Eucalyptus globulus]|uniref:Rx N-terminal domain-containing protein n=1 Tax=Eucalyptus globulus TaxID=34317 RepID=A0ABD3K397_EUCGL